MCNGRLETKRLRREGRGKKGERREEGEKWGEEGGGGGGDVT